MQCASRSNTILRRVSIRRPAWAAPILAAALASSASFVFAQPAAAATSTVEIQAPPLATVNAYNWLTASVSSSDGTTRPTGGVQFLNTTGQVVATATLSPGASPGSATASAPWFPTQLTNYSFTAVFNSTTPGLTGATTSQPTTIMATPNGSMVQISAPPMRLGVPATLIASVYPATLQGSVSFGANGYPMSASIPVKDGTASFTFVPRGFGWQRFDVDFTVLGKPNEFGAVSQWVFVGN